MRITICGSMAFHKEMSQVKMELENLGHQVAVPDELDNIEHNEAYMSSVEDKISSKIEFDFIRAHFAKIQNSDAVLILNYDKKGVKGYIGGNTFLEMGYAFGLGKRLFVLNPLPQMDYYTEMVAMQPTVLEGRLSNIPSHL